MSVRKKLAIIDGKSVFYRGYYAMPNLSTKDGTPTGGVYGFAMLALEVIKRLKPDYVCVAWDKPKTNIRRRLELYSEYKAGRKPAPPDFKVQIPILHELLDAFGWPLYELDDYEADDIMGTLAVQAREQDIETMLISSDLDMLQVINGHTHMYALKKGLSNIELFHPEAFEKKYGIKVEQFLDLKALKGDSSDNIPGVPGIGEKGAVDLLKQFKTLEGVYENLALVKDSVRKKLEAGKESAILSKKLAQIWTDAPIRLDLKALDMSNCDPAKVQTKLQELEFRTLARQLPEAMRTEPAEVGSEKWGVGSSGKVVTIDSDKKLQAITEKEFGQSEEIVIHSRAAGKHGRDPQLLIISPNPKTTYAINLQKISHGVLLTPHSSLLTSQAKLVGYDLKSTLKVLLELGIELPKVKHDVLIGAFLLNSLRRVQSLTELAITDLGYGGGSLEEIDNEQMIERAGEITGVIRRLHEQQHEALTRDSKLMSLASKIEWPVIPVLARMEHTGIKLDTAHLTRIRDQIDDRISDLEQEIYGHADNEFNIGSTQQLADILFGKLNLPTLGIKKGKTGYSTAASELDKLRGQHPIVDLISQWREVTKLKNTYVDTLPNMVDENSRVHTTYHLTVAQTGRLSSADPNLQNIPIRTELGREIRTAFVAGTGNMLVSADYSQQELRLAAYLSGDDELVDMFNKGVDVHAATAAQIHGRSLEDVTKNMRRHAKTVNFGIMYGLGPHGLAAATGMTREQARHFIDKYFEVRPKLFEYIESVRDQAKKDKYVKTILGRRRPTPDVHSSNFAVREAAIRAAVNMPFQGSAADIMKLAMVKVQQKLDALNAQEKGTGRKEKGDETNHPTPHSPLLTPAGEARILLQIHDSLIVECPESEAENTAETMKETMEQVIDLPIKLTVDTSIGKNWGQL